MDIRKAALGLRAHSGWAVVVALSGESPILRRRIAMAGDGGDPPKQPYHAAEAMPLPEAEAFIQRAEAAAIQMASAAVKDAIVELAGEGYRVNDGAVLLGAGKPLPQLAKILAAHPLIHTAEGVFFRNVLVSACEACGLNVTGITERNLLAECAAVLRITGGELQSRLLAMGKEMGPPWTQDEKPSAAAALMVLR